MLLLSPLVALSMAVPAALGVVIETSVFSISSLVCSTRYDSTSLEGAIPTSATERYTEHGPVMFHTTLTPIATFTPKPRITTSTQFVVNTTWVTTAPSSQVWNSTSTVIETLTDWDHVYVTETKAINITGTSRSTVWLPAPTDFRAIKDTRAGWHNAVDHPHKIREVPSKPSSKCRRPLASRYIAAYDCTMQIQVWITESVIAVVDWTATTRLPRETIYDTTTSYASITSTVVDPEFTFTKPAEPMSTSKTEGAPATRTSSALESISSAPALLPRNYKSWIKYFKDHSKSSATEVSTVSTGAAPAIETSESSGKVKEESELAAAISAAVAAALSVYKSSAHVTGTTLLPGSSGPASMSPPANGIITNVVNITRTPFTTMNTWTGTATVTSIRHVNATHTLTSYAACATNNLLGMTSKTKRINGIAPNIQGQQVEHVIPGVPSSYDCCLACVTGDLACAFSMYEAEGEKKGRCVLYVRQDNIPPQQNAIGGGREAERGQCVGQQAGGMGLIDFRERNGETAFVASNGLCGYLAEGDLVSP